MEWGKVGVGLMACSVKIASLSPEAANTIRTMLCLQPDTPNTKYNRGKIPDPVTFYLPDGDEIHLPYLFAASLLQITPNLNHPFALANFEFTGTLRENQIAVEIEAWQQLERYGTSTLGLYPGYGKTILGAKLSARSKLLTVVLVHREILTVQWKKSFEDVTGARVWIVGEKNPPDYCDVIICMDTRWNVLPKAMRDSVGFLIIDEAHCFCTPTRVQCLLAFHPKYILIESGSLERDDNMHSMIYAIAGSHGVYRESTKPFKVMKIMTNTKPIRKKNRMGGIDYIALVNNTLMDVRRNQIIINLVLANAGFKILILTSLVDHAKLLNDALVERGVSSDCLCGTRKNYQDANVLVGTVSKIGTGFDQANFCATYDGRPFNLLILACSLKKYSMLIQNVGRVFRSESPTVMHLVDNDDIFKAHWYKARKWYLTRGGEITDHHIPNAETPAPTTENITAGQSDWVASKVKQLALHPRTAPTPIITPAYPLPQAQSTKPLPTIKPLAPNTNQQAPSTIKPLSLIVTK